MTKSLSYLPKDPTKGANKRRNQEIIKLVDGERLSYEVIAGMTGVSRNTVAGIVFRHRHARRIRASSPNGSNNKTGTGWIAPSYWPEKTAQNTR